MLTVSATRLPNGLLRQPEIEDFCRTPVRDENVRRLDIAMHDAPGMRRVERIGDLRAPIEQQIDGKRPPAEAFPKRLPLDQFHHQKRPAFVLAHVVDRADARMIESRGRARFALEAFERGRIPHEVLRQEFQRHLAPQPRIFGAKNLAHAAAAQDFYDPVMGD